MKKTTLVRYFLAVVFFAIGSVAGIAQQKLALPVVSFAEVPFYPPLAQAANVSGIVHLTITTDGHRVVETHVQDGKKVLSDAAEQNAKSWQFRSHEPTTFTVMYVYKLVDNLKLPRNAPRVVLQLPAEVEIDAARWLGTKDLAPTLSPHRTP